MTGKLRFMALVLLAAGLGGLARAQTPIYVSTTGTNDVANRFNTWDGAATNIFDAVAIATNGETVLVTNGFYRLTNQLPITAAITLLSVNGTNVTSLYRAAADPTYFRLLAVSNAGATVQGFTLSNGVATLKGGGIYLQAGLVRDCMIANCEVSHGTTTGTGGGGIRMEGGAVSNTTIVGCRTLDAVDTGHCGAGIWMTAGKVSKCTIQACYGKYGILNATGGTLEDCTICFNTNTYYYGSYSANTTLRRCRIFNNAGAHDGGGIQINSGTLMENCLVYSNRATSRGGGGIQVNGGTVDVCTVANNWTATLTDGGGISQGGGTIRNSIIYGNTRLDGAARDYIASGGTITYSCAPELSAGVNGNVSGDPLFVNPALCDYHLAHGSPCIDTGTNLVFVTTDIDLASRPVDGDWVAGAAWDMGAYEAPAAASGPLDLVFSGAPRAGVTSLDAVFTAHVFGTNTDIAWYGWDFTNTGSFNMTGPGLGVVTNTYGPGLYSVRLAVSNSAGESVSKVLANWIMVSSTNIYVSTTGLSKFPYSSWDNAATNIHDAVAAALSGADILVSNGFYRLTNQIALTVPMTLHSVNGTNATSLYRAAADSAYFRLLSVNSTGAVVQGFTLSNGVATLMGGGIWLQAGTVRDCVITNCEVSHGTTTGTGGGGIRMDGGLVSNTVITGCRTLDAVDTGHCGAGIWMTAGKVASSTIRNCTGKYGALYATGGTAEDCTIRDCTSTYYYGNYFGGVALRRCRIINNAGAHDGGGLRVAGGIVENCLIYSNRATTRYGGGFYISGGTVQNCTVANNDVVSGSSGGGVYQTGGSILNTIVYGNTLGGVTADNYKYTAASIAYSCAPELASGVNSNINANPLFKNAANLDYHLQFGSPCIDTGTNLVAVTNDIDRTFRPLDGDGVGGAAWDMGCYEAFDSSTGPLNLTFSASPRTGLNSVNAVFTAHPTGSDTNIVWYGWDFDNNGSYDLTGPGLGVVTQNLTAGRYTVSLLVSNASGEAASATNVNYIAVSVPDIFVATNGTSIFPYSSWTTAATNVYDAANAAIGGSTIHLTNGTFLTRYQIILADAIVLRGEMGAANSILARDAVGGNFGVLMMTHTSAVVQGVTIAQGYATTLGGGIYLTAGTVRDCIVTNCETTGSSGTGGGGIYMVAGLVTNTVLVNCRATGSTQQGGGLWMIGGKCANGTIRACQGYTGGGFYASGGTLEDCTIRDCSASYINASYAGNTAIRRCRFFNNSAAYWGGAIAMDAGVTLENCLIYSNQLTSSPNPSATGGGIRMQGGVVVNCTVARNTATYSGGGIQCDGGLVTNSIVYFNMTNGVPNDFAGAVANAFYSCAPELTAGVHGNKTNNPLFKNAAAGDYHLALGSPCYGAGTNFSGIAALDLDLHPRVRRGGVVDMGAYSVQPPQGMLVIFR